MKATQILYILVFITAIYLIVTSTHLLGSDEGFEDLLQTPNSEPIIPNSLKQAKIDSKAMPNPSIPGELPFGPYLQSASVGSYQYKDPVLLPANVQQMKKLYEDLRSFLVFEGVSISDSSDPSVQLPLTQLRSDSRKIEQELLSLKNNPGIDSQLTQQNLADIEGSLVFLQRKVRLFQTSGLVSEGFENPVKTIATKADLELLQTKAYGAILILSASRTTDPVVQARIQNLQTMYSSISDMITKLNNGQITPDKITVYKEDIQNILPNLANPSTTLGNIFSQGSGKQLNPIEQQLSQLVGNEYASSVFNDIKEKGSFRISLDLGYNTNNYKRTMNLQQDGSMKSSTGIYPHSVNNHESPTDQKGNIEENADTNLPFDTTTPGMDDRNIPATLGRFDWKARATSISDQIKLRGMNPEDFGCIPKGSMMSPAYSWRGHTKMICGRLAATMDPDLPTACGCPPQSWKGWTLSL
jgi:hypothetical protein